MLYVDDINLLDSEATNILLQVISDGKVIVEREGISVTYACKPLVIATFNPEEGEMRDHVLDRIAVSLSADAAPLDIAQRAEAVDSVLTFAAGGEKRAKSGATTTPTAATPRQEARPPPRSAVSGRCPWR